MKNITCLWSEELLYTRLKSLLIDRCKNVDKSIDDQDNSHQRKHNLNHSNIQFALHMKFPLRPNLNHIHNKSGLCCRNIFDPSCFVIFDQLFTGKLDR